MTAASFSAEWLKQREPFDIAARQAAAGQLGEADVVRALPRPGGESRVLDLGAGTGANLRYLAPRLGGRQHWQVVDNDAALLAAWPRRMRDWAETSGGQATDHAGLLQVDAPGFSVTVQRLHLDLSRPLPARAFDGTTLVTASALLDLMSEPSLRMLLEQGCASQVAWWFALSVDGRFNWPEPDADDTFVAAAYAGHQRRDKGFGPALGAAAPAFAAGWLARRGYRLHEAESDWQLSGAIRAAQIDGMAQAAREERPAESTRIDAWRVRRLASGGAMQVGHRELIALPVHSASP